MTFTEWFSRIFVPKQVYVKPVELPAVVVDPKWLQIAMKELGQAEVPGGGDNPRIVEYHSVTTLKATEDSVPWCGSFTSWCLEKSGIKSTRSARARSYEDWGKPIGEPKRGAIVTFTRDGGGHVGFFLEKKDGKWMILGGNQGDKVSIGPFDVARVTSVRWPQ